MTCKLSLYPRGVKIHHRVECKAESSSFINLPLIVNSSYNAFLILLFMNCSTVDLLFKKKTKCPSSKLPSSGCWRDLQAWNKSTRRRPWHRSRSLVTITMIKWHPMAAIRFVDVDNRWISWLSAAICHI